MKDQGHPATIAPGRKNQFDVLSDGDLLFSKESSGHFPELDEILATLKA